MKPNNAFNATIEGDLDGETVRMELDAAATKHLMSVLTDLYSDRIMAFIREYATNAHDAQLEAGVTRPIEVTLPNRLSAYYKIRDYGVGLDLDDIRNVYSKYGTSTKRDSNAYNGMLGLGSKSAMTYAAQFSVTSIKNGVRYSVSVSRGADGVGEMQVIDQTETTQPNGVEITIPVRANDMWAVAEKAREFFKWWPEGSVLIDGKQPKHFEGREVAPGLFMVDDLENDLIVMGNVAYPIPYEGGIYTPQNSYYRSHGFGVVYFAPMGSVTFTPNREALQTVSNTKDTVEKAKVLFAENVKKSIQKDIDAQPTHLDAASLQMKVVRNYNGLDLSSLTYKGEKFPTDGVEAPFKMVPGKVMHYHTIRGTKPDDEKQYDYFTIYDARGGSQGNKTAHLTMDWLVRNVDNVLFVLNAPKEISKHHQNKSRKAYQNNEFTKPVLVFTNMSTIPGAPWTTGMDSIDWSLIRDFKVASNSVSDPTVHEVYEKDGTTSDRQVPDNEKIVYVGPRQLKDARGNTRVNWYTVRAHANESGHSFVILSANRHDKFKREHKNALSLAEFAKQRIDKWTKTLSKEDKILLGIEGEVVTQMVALRQVDVADPDVVEWCKAADESKWRAAHQSLRQIQNDYGYAGVQIPEFEEVNPLANYPLVKNLSDNGIIEHAEHVRDYIKAVYDGMKGN